MFRRGSDLEAVENEVDIIEDKHVMAGWRSVTRGTFNLVLGLNRPESMSNLSLLAMADKWNFMDFSW